MSDNADVTITDTKISEMPGDWFPDRVWTKTNHRRVTVEWEVLKRTSWLVLASLLFLILKNACINIHSHQEPVSAAREQPSQEHVSQHSRAALEGATWERAAL